VLSFEIARILSGVLQDCSSPDTGDSDFGVRRLVAALPFSHGIFGNLRGKTVNIPFQFQVKSAGQTNVVPRAK
jgi:hypothetical protein